MRWLWLALGGFPLWAGAEEPRPAPPPTDDQCPALSVAPEAAPVRPGEVLEYALDALGAQAGRMVVRVLPPRDGLLPVEGRAETNAFFAKIRRVQAKATTFLDARTLQTRRYEEDSIENETHRTATVTFQPEDHGVAVRFTNGERRGMADWRYANQGVDALSALYALRRIPLKADTSLCMDSYGIRHLWRVSGKVVEREHLSLALGEFDAWHLVGEAVRLDDHSERREVHIWISDDPRRLPLVALGTLDVGVVRAVLTGFREPGKHEVRAQSKADLKW